MDDAQSVTLTPELAVAVARAAAWRGMSSDQYISAVVKTAAQLDAQLAADIQQGEDDLAAGRSYTQEQVEAMFGIRREQCNAA